MISDTPEIIPWLEDVEFNISNYQVIVVGWKGIVLFETMEMPGHAGNILVKYQFNYSIQTIFRDLTPLPSYASVFSDCTLF